MPTETINYECNGLNFKGLLVTPASVGTKKLPGIVIAHAWKGRDKFADQKAQALTELGYIGFAVDLYGDGKIAKDNEEATQLMLPLFLDRQLIRQRMTAAIEALKKHSLVDTSAIGAIGFCFGGLCAIELLRSGADVKGVVSFHGLQGFKFGEHRAHPAPSAKMKGSLLILQGNEDPFVTTEDLTAVRKEFTDAGVDWQLDIYGQTMHAFTNPEAKDPKNGMVYNAKADKRSSISMRNFFSEIFKQV